MQQLTREKRIATAAIIQAETYAGPRKGIQCRPCNGMVYTSKKGPTALYEALGIHLAKNHPELKDELEQAFYDKNLG